MSDIEISLQQARSFQILSLGLGTPRQQPAQKEDLLPVIRQMGLLQLDTIHIVARSHYFVMWSRLGQYNPEWLDDLLREKQLFEYWAHAASWLPMEDYPLMKWRIEEEISKRENPNTWAARNADLISAIRARVEERGPVTSSDFPPESKASGTWWSWSAEKSALEALYTMGELMVARRDKFQRVYELTARLHPEISSLPPIDGAVARAALIERTVKILGVCQPRWVADYYRLPKKETQQILDKFLVNGTLLPVKVEGWNVPGLIHPENLPLLKNIQEGAQKPSGTSLLSPFDPLAWDRARLQGLFGMDFKVECYTVPEQRKYGYWLLPILHENQMAGRVDIKANRQRKVLELKGIFLEPGMLPDAGFIQGLTDTLRSCASFHHLESIEIGACSDVDFKADLQESLKI